MRSELIVCFIIALSLEFIRTPWLNPVQWKPLDVTRSRGTCPKFVNVSCWIRQITDAKRFADSSRRHKSIVGYAVDRRWKNRLKQYEALFAQ